jgi:2-oxoisovalerate dehydrogenase E2 component (dihydrolipoyl transacylase)
VKPGDLVREDTVLAAVMTDKATVEIPSPVEGKVVWLAAEVGETISVGAPLVRIEVAGDADTADERTEESSASQKRKVETDSAEHHAPASGKTDAEPARPRQTSPEATSLAGEAEYPATAAPHPAPRADSPGGIPRPPGEKPLASPAVRLRARELGIDLRQVPGTGPAGRITHDDLDAFIARGREPTPQLRQPRLEVEEIRVVGLRRRIAEKMALSKSRIPHITYVEEVDVSALEDLRALMNRDRASERPKLTLLPFLMRAMVRAIGDQPEMNAIYDDETGIVRRHAGVHIGIAVQTAAGLMVPVVRHAETLDLWQCAAELARLSEAARNGTAARQELSGSTITITSLGAMGGIVTTPVINHPEVAIVGVNKIAVRPHWDGTQFVPRRMMNLSSSFDHRIIDGWDAARFVQRLKTLMESPALIFVDA